MKRPTILRPTQLAALAAALAASVAATAVPAQAAVSSASINDLTATLNLDGADDNVTVSVVGGLLVHGQTTGGLASGSDWDSGTAGNQTVPADGTRTVDRQRRRRQRLDHGGRQDHRARQLGAERRRRRRCGDGPGQQRHAHRR